MKVTKIYSNDGTLSFSGKILATVAEYTMGDRSIGSIFEGLEPRELIEITLQGLPHIYEIDSDLDVIDLPNEWYERTDRRPGDLEDGEWLVHCRNDGTLGSATDRTYHAID